MAISIRPLHPHFVGEVSGVDLTRPLTPDQAFEIEAGMDKYAVLVFHDQNITDEQQLAFAEKLAGEKGIALTDEQRSSRAALGAFLDVHAPKDKAAKPAAKKPAAKSAKKRKAKA